jgi:copper chaperone
MLVTRELSAAGMSCGHCKMTIENAVRGLNGIEKVNADLATKKVVVEFDESSVTIEDIRNTIEEAGYTAEVEEDSV